METIRIEILNPKARKLIQSLQELNLIKVADEPASKLKAYLAKMRKSQKKVPTMEEITSMVEEVRSERYAKK